MAARVGFLSALLDMLMCILIGLTENLPIVKTGSQTVCCSCPKPNVVCN